MDKVSRKREREETKDEIDKSIREVRSRLDSLTTKPIRKEKNGYDFEKEVSKILQKNGYIVYNENFQKNEFIKGKPRASQRVYEIDILMYKTIVECKNLYLEFLEYNEFTLKNTIEQIERFYKYFPDFAIVLWFKGNNEKHPIYTHLLKLFPKLIITDNIEDFKKKYVPPKEYYYVGKKETIWTMISRSNKIDYREIWKNTKINSKFIEYIDCFIFDPVEIENFKIFKSLVIQTDEYDPFDVLIVSSKVYSDIHRKYYSVGKDADGNGIFRFCYFIPKTHNIKARADPKFKIEGYEHCIICSKIWNVRKLKDKICRLCFSH